MVVYRKIINTMFKSIIKHMVLMIMLMILYFSNDSSKYGWRFKKDKKYYVQINNKTFGPYDYAFESYISLMMAQNLDGDWGRIVKKQNMMEYLLYAKNTTFKSIIKHMVLMIMLMALYFLMIVQNMDGSLEKDNKYYIQINDKIYGPYDKATFTFTKDNKAYIAYISGNELIIEEVE
jgi:hypothetical protein